MAANTPPPPGWTPAPCPKQPGRNPKLMALNPIADAIVRMEGADSPRSVNMTMVRNFGLWNVGHLVWANQYGATKTWVGDRYWAGWPTREDAYAGLLRDLGAKARVGHTIESAMYKYAPPKENNTANYIAYIEQQTGWSRNTPLSAIVAGTVVPNTGNTPIPVTSTGQPDPLMLDTTMDVDSSGASAFVNDDGTITLDFGSGDDNTIMLVAAAAAGIIMLLAMPRS